MLDLEVLLAAVSPDAPCGPDLEYDPDFTALEQAARGKPEHGVGGKVVAAEEPDWSEVARRAETLLARSKDIRIAILYGRALTRTEDLLGLSVALTLMRGMLEQYWDCVHPRLDPADGNDPTSRLNALAPLADAGGLLRDVRGAFVVRPCPHGRVTVRDILVVQGKLAPGPASRSQAEVEGIIRAAGASQLVLAKEAKIALEAITRIQSLLAEKVGSDRAPDLKPLADALNNVVQLCVGLLGAADAAGLEAGQSAAGAVAANPRMLEDIRSREDVARLLDKVCEFIERTEPSNPAPLFIRRAQKLMVKNFVELIQELAPESLAPIKKMTGLEK